MRKETEATGKGRAGWKGKRRHAKRKPNIKRIRRSALLVISVYEASFDEYFQNKLV